MSDPLRSTLTMVDQVDAALELMVPARRDSAPGRLAIMYAEAIDDDDEGDGVFRFGSRLLTALEALGLAQTARALLLPRPMVGCLRPVEGPSRRSPANPLILAA